MASELADREMIMRQKMTPPVGGQAMSDLSRSGDAPEWYNYSGMPSAKYAVPNEMKDRMVARAAIRNAAASDGSANVPRPDPIRDEEVDYLQAMKKQAAMMRLPSSASARGGGPGGCRAARCDRLAALASRARPTRESAELAA